MRIRKTKTASGATAVQVVDSRYGQTLVHKHIGSATTPKDVARLWEAARKWMLTASRQRSSPAHTRATLNQSLIERTRLLWGIKGYITNIAAPNELVIVRYHDLWHVEQSFRMAKSDLLSRPIFHFKQESIKAHLLICVMALAVGKYMEMHTGKSLQRILDQLRQLPNALVEHIATKKQSTWHVEIPEETKQLLTTLGYTY